MMSGSDALLTPQIRDLIDLPLPVPEGTITPERRLILFFSIRLAYQSSSEAAVEVGVLRGETARLIKTCRPDCDLYLYDTFDGLPPPSAGDVGCFNYPSRWLKGDAGGLDGFATVVRGDVTETLPDRLPERISFAHIDLDLYAGTKHALDSVWPRVVPGGVVVIDDYCHPAWPGVHRAVNELAVALRLTVEAFCFGSMNQAYQAVIRKPLT